jgi:uncharacterized protein YycO
MATLDELNHIPKIQYPLLRDTIEAGDLLFYSGDDDISMLIREVTQSIWSHIGIVFKIENLDRILLLESVESFGVRLIPISRYIKGVGEDMTQNEAKPHARLVVARHIQLTEAQIRPLVNFGLDQIAQPYDLDEIRRIMQRIRTGEGKAVRDRAYMCSELVFECFEAVGLGFPYHPLGFISPQDIWASEHIKAIAEIEHTEV